jgi:hypothetical protein
MKLLLQIEAQLMKPSQEVNLLYKEDPDDPEVMVPVVVN